MEGKGPSPPRKAPHPEKGATTGWDGWVRDPMAFPLFLFLSGLSSHTAQFPFSSLDRKEKHLGQSLEGLSLGARKGFGGGGSPADQLFTEP